MLLSTSKAWIAVYVEAKSCWHEFNDDREPCIVDERPELCAWSKKRDVERSASRTFFKVGREQKKSFFVKAVVMGVTVSEW